MSRIRWWALIGVISPALIIAPPGFGAHLWFVAAAVAVAVVLKWDLALVLAGFAVWSISMLKVRTLTARQTR